MSPDEVAIITEPGPATDGSRLATAIELFLCKILSLPKAAKALLPVWIMHTHVYDEFDFTPYLNVESPEPGCGKSTLAEVLEMLCCGGLASSGTAAALRRLIAAGGCTLIIDEWDTIADDTRRACYNFLNTGFKYDGNYPIIQSGEVVRMSTFCAKAICGRANVKLPDATLSRCIRFTIHKALSASWRVKLSRNANTACACSSYNRSTSSGADIRYQT
jgi:hypothetical protein